MRCQICAKYPHIVKQFNPRKPLQIASEKGTRAIAHTLNAHLKSQCHAACLQADRVSSLRIEERPSTSMEVSIGNVNRKSVSRVGKLMLQVYLDAKLLNLPAHSWPARHVAGEASSAYDAENQSRPTIADNINLQYVNPHGHHELMSSIVKSYHQEFVKKIDDAWAISLRVDGSVDFTQIDKIYVMAKIINLDGSSELLFIGVGKQTQRKAIGLKNAVMEASKAAINDPKQLLRTVSFLCTDGTNVNTDDRTSLWQLLDQEMITIDSGIPLLKIWCAAHRAELVWKDSSEKFSAVGKVLSVLSSIASYFNQSGLRRADLDNNLTVFRLPKIFEIRWTQFTFTLIRNVLFSWKTLVLYFEKNKEEAACGGFRQYLENLELIVFLADVLFVFQRFQKNLQSDRLTLISMMSQNAAIKKSLEQMETTPLVGAFENKLAEKITIEADGKKYLKGIELLVQSCSLRRQHVESFPELRKNILVSIRTFLDERFDADEALLQLISEQSTKRWHPICRCPICPFNSRIF